MTQQPAPARTLADIIAIDSEVALNWATLREILASDIRIFTSLAADWPAGSAGRNRFEAKAEHAQQVLDSMNTIESTPSPLAEHTAAACDTITRAAR